MSSGLIAARNRSCVPCRLVSGAGMLGISGYLAYHGRRNPSPAGRLTIYSLALGFAGLGVARWSELYPFDKSETKS